MTINSQLSNVFEQMQQIIEDRQNGLRMTGNILAFDDKLNQLSLGYLCSVEVNEIKFSSADHAFQYLRAMAFKDTSAMQQIASVATAKQAKTIPVRYFTANAWRKYELRSMQVVVGAKLQQNPEINKALKMTGYKRLVCANGSDTYFGCGLPLSDDNVLYPQFWTGQNQYGRVLERFRNNK